MDVAQLTSNPRAFVIGAINLDHVHARKMIDA